MSNHKTTFSTDPCILELRDRVEALEAQSNHIGDSNKMAPPPVATDEELRVVWGTAKTPSQGDRAIYNLGIEHGQAGSREVTDPAPVAGEVVDLRLMASHAAEAGQLGDAEILARAADSLERLEQVAYAASDVICGTRFPEFANEHGGIDRLMNDLCRLVAQFEHGPRPVPGVDVPGPDGDWGGLAELCNAEGVDLRIGVPLLQRAQEAWKYASQIAPVATEAPMAGALVERVSWLIAGFASRSKPGDDCKPTAVKIVVEVARWLRFEMDWKEAADLFEQEAGR
jgi:hypothetical protein